MRILLALAVGSLTLSSISASAEATAESSLIIGARNVQSARQGQAIYCTKPRTNTTERCREDFEAYIKATIEFTGLHLTFLVAKEKGEEEKWVKRLEERANSFHRKVFELAESLDRDYVPLPSTSQSPAPSTVGQSTPTVKPKPAAVRQKTK